LIIQAKARSLFGELNAVELDPKVSFFVASAGWFERFKGRHGFHNLELTGEAAAGDVVAAEKFPAQFPALTDEHGTCRSKCSILMKRGCSGSVCQVEHFYRWKKTGPRDLKPPRAASHCC
jgi:hypothetical protein